MIRPTDEQLADWRYQCEERIRRWEQGQAVPSWHLGIRETLALLDLVRDLMAVLDLNRDLSAEVERLRGALEAERRQHALIARNRARDAETATERQACEDIARCIERSRPARKGHTP